MSSSLLPPSPSINDLSKITNRQDAWLFIDRLRDAQAKLRLDLTHEDGSDFEYYGYEQILIDNNAYEMIESFYHWENEMPPLINILNLVMGDFTGPDSCSDQNIIEELMENVDLELSKTGMPDDEIDSAVELLNDLARDMYNYLTYTLVHFSLIEDFKIWEFLTCKKAHMTDGKLYMTVQIYVDALRDLDFMDERTDVDFVEVVNGIQKIFVASESRRRGREVYRRTGEGGLASRLLG